MFITRNRLWLLPQMRTTAFVALKVSQWSVLVRVELRGDSLLLSDVCHQVSSRSVASQMKTSAGFEIDNTVKVAALILMFIPDSSVAGSPPVYSRTGTVHTFRGGSNCFEIHLLNLTSPRFFTLLFPFSHRVLLCLSLCRHYFQFSPSSLSV